MKNEKQLLVVEDIPDSLVATLRELSSTGYNVTIVNCVDDAKIKLEKNKYDAVLLDWRIPIGKTNGISEEGGRHLLEHLDALSTVTGKFIPFIVVTAQKNAIDWDRVSASPGYLGSVYKFYVDDIQDLLESHFSRKS